MSLHDLVIAILFLITALLYSSVGHAGASGYLAVMALLGTEPILMKPTALVLNALVAAIGSWNFWRGGWFRWRLFWPFALSSIPAAYCGGALELPDIYYKPLVGVVLLYSSWRLVTVMPVRGEQQPLPSLFLCLLVGTGLGLLSGLTGVGGGIFLSPLLVLMGWATIREASGVAAPFILVNSLAGLWGRGLAVSTLPSAMPWWMLTVIVGGALGSWLGSRRLNVSVIRWLLAVVLALAALKMLLTSFS